MNKAVKVLKIALPVVGEMFLYTTIWVVDTAFVGHYGGNDAVSAVGYSSEIVRTIVNIFIMMGLGIGVTTTVAQHIGAKEQEKAEEVLNQGILVGFMIAILVSLSLGLFSEQILKLAGASGEVVKLGSQFMRIVSVGAFFNMLLSILNAGLRGMGKTVIPLIISLVINVLVIFLDWTLIFGRFGLQPLGVVGSALATSIGYSIGFMCLLFYYKRYSEIKIKIKAIIKLNQMEMRKLVRISVPASLQEGTFSLARILVLIFVMQMGTIAFSANQITATIESVSFMPGYGFAIASMSLVGQSIGAKDYKQAKEYAVLSAVFCVGTMMVCIVPFLLIPEKLFGIFIDDPETIHLGVKCLMLAALEQPFLALGMTLEGALKGSGNTKTPFKIALLTNWVLRVPLVYWFVVVLRWPVHFVWVVFAIHWIVESSLMVVAFIRQSRKWDLLA
ncbi:MATE family efflux transporter [Clostridium aminobutyricum]|uniref:Probable multidrug resistance protein NorM n=1 Tax=Clostridium aminobutyricum TaxID=33953 RepID=A0A939IHP3_CLOAM|nr:MATE family efflux transporter [Clostridium aminobutyricum]MBN7772241.1 MATE family efflux transporter [Clostridium aminobutyricum]